MPRPQTLLFPGYHQLLERAEKLKLPKNPLDDLLERLGGPEVRASIWV